jgi:ferredoxin
MSNIGSIVALPKEFLDQLISLLQDQGYQTIGPKVKDQAITHGPISSLKDLPQGYVSTESAGTYRLMHTGHTQYFTTSRSPNGWKQYLFPPKMHLLEAVKMNGDWGISIPEDLTPKYAFIGVRPCDLAAIEVQDKVFIQSKFIDPTYQRRRVNLFIITVNCLSPGETCFCASLGTGPKTKSGFDLSITELEDAFLIEIGSEAGRTIMEMLPYTPATSYMLQQAEKELERASQEMKRKIENIETVPDILAQQLEHPHWDEVAKRCLSCASCTQVCPTCFCWDAVDYTDITGTKTQRERVWDSCFNPDYSYHGFGNTRPTIHSRYRQWLTHKMSAWVGQFGTLGCVGCGRCITWCPTGIDITEEVTALCKEETTS